jgi:hypothetical protein
MNSISGEVQGLNIAASEKACLKDSCLAGRANPYLTACPITGTSAVGLWARILSMNW